MHDVVALLEDMRAQHFTTGQPLTLRRRRIGTVNLRGFDPRSTSNIDPTPDRRIGPQH